jgi:acetoin utilization protein AcuB
MSRNPVSIHQDESIYTAIEIFEKNNISCIPVVDGNQVPVGILSWRDIFKAIKKKE